MKKILVIMFACVSFNCFGISAEDLAKNDMFREWSDQNGRRFFAILKKMDQLLVKSSNRMTILKINLSIEADLIEDSLLNGIKRFEDGIERESKLENPNWQYLYNQQTCLINLYDSLHLFRELVVEVMNSNR